MMFLLKYVSEIETEKVRKYYCWIDISDHFTMYSEGFWTLSITTEL